MDREKYKLTGGAGASPEFQSTEQQEPLRAGNWRPAPGSSWLAALAVGCCAVAFGLVSKCLLRLEAAPFPLELAAGALALGLAVGMLEVRAQRRGLRPPGGGLVGARFADDALHLWLLAAVAMGSVWAFASPDPRKLNAVIAAFYLFAGVALGPLLARRPFSVLFAAAGAAGAWFSAGRWLPATGYTLAVYAVAGLLLLAYLIVAVAQRTRLSVLLLGVGLSALAGFYAPGDLARSKVPEGWKLFGKREGLDAAVMLIEKQTAPGQPLLQRLILDGRYIVGGQLGFGEKRLGHVPLLLKPDARNVLFLNVNSGVSMGAAKTHIGLEKIDCVEPLAEVAAFLPQFSTSNDRIYDEPRAKFFHADVRRFLTSSNTAYDVIVANPLPPSREGNERLFTGGFYGEVAGRLAPGGVFLQWLPLFELDERNLKTILRTFLAGFPDAQGFVGIYNGELPVFGLFARAGHGRAGVPAAPDIQKALHPNLAARAYVADVRDLLGCRMLDAAALRGFAGDGPKHADAGPALEFPRDFRRSPQDARRGGELLGRLLAHTATNASFDTLAGLGPAEAEEALRKVIAARTETLRHYLAADILRARAEEKNDREMAAEYLMAYNSEPDLPIVRAMLNLQAKLKPKIAVQIMRGILIRTPDDKAAQAVMCTVQEVNAEIAGVPLPPSECAPGKLPTNPPSSGRKMPVPSAPSPPRLSRPPAAATNPPAPAVPEPAGVRF